MGEYEQFYGLHELPDPEVARGWTHLEVIEDCFMARAIDYSGVVPDTLDDPDDDPMNQVEWIISLPKRYGGPSATDAPRALVLSDYYCSHTGYFGNEASGDTIYAYAAIVMDILPASNRPKVTRATAPAPAKSTVVETATGGASSPDHKKAKLSSPGVAPVCDGPHKQKEGNSVI
jgi:hypothetical protein